MFARERKISRLPSSVGPVPDPEMLKTLDAKHLAACRWMLQRDLFPKPIVRKPRSIFP